MKSLKNIFLSSGLIIFFKAIAIYNILKYIQCLEKTNNKKIKNMNKKIEQNYDAMILNYNELKEKYDTLQEKYDELMVELKKTKEEINSLNNEWIKKEEKNINEPVKELEDVSKINYSNDLTENNLSLLYASANNICLNNEFVNSEPTDDEIDNNSVIDNKMVDNKIIDNDTLEVNTINTNPALYNSISIKSSYSNKDVNLRDSKYYTTRTRSNSLSDVNWVVSTAKFFFG